MSIGTSSGEDNESKEKKKDHPTECHAAQLDATECHAAQLDATKCPAAQRDSTKRKKKISFEKTMKSGHDRKNQRFHLDLQCVEKKHVKTTLQRTIKEDNIDLKDFDFLVFDFDDTLISSSWDEENLTHPELPIIDIFFESLVDKFGKKVAICSNGNRVSQFASRRQDLYQEQEDKVFVLSGESQFSHSFEMRKYVPEAIEDSLDQMACRFDPKGWLIHYIIDDHFHCDKTSKIAFIDDVFDLVVESQLYLQKLGYINFRAFTIDLCGKMSIASSFPTLRETPVLRLGIPVLQS